MSNNNKENNNNVAINRLSSTSILMNPNNSPYLDQYQQQLSPPQLQSPTGNNNNSNAGFNFAQQWNQLLNQNKSNPLLLNALAALAANSNGQTNGASFKF